MQVWVFVYAQSPLFIKAGKRVMISSGCMQITSVQMRALSCTHTVCVCVCVCVCQLLSARCRQCRRWAQRLWGSNFYKLQVRWSTLHWTVKTLLVRFVRHCHRSWSSSDEDDDHHRRRRRLRRHHHLIGGTKKRHVPVLWVPITSRPCALITSHPITSEGACSSIAQ